MARRKVGTMEMFRLNRLVDDTGISGTGIIAEGVRFSDGRCALRFLTRHRSTVIYDRIEDLIAIHSHDGKTKIEWGKASWKVIDE